MGKEQHWQTLADQNKWLVAVYKSGKCIKAGVFRLNGAYIDDKGKIRMQTEMGKVAREKYIGEIVDMGPHCRELKLESLLWFDIVDDFEIEDVARFKQTVLRVERMAALYE